MVFDKYTKEKEGNRGFRLLLVDEHYSHINLDFFDYAVKNQIIVLVLLPYVTYQLQPLDVGLFLPLSKAYSWELSNYFAKGQSLVSIFRRLFYSFFEKALEVSFTESNQYDPEKTLPICAKKPPSTPIKEFHVRFALKTPLSYHAIRQLVKQREFDAKNTYIQAMLWGSE